MAMELVVTLPPSPFDDYPHPLDANIKPVEEFLYGAVSEVEAWIKKAMAGPPSAGTIGRMELLRHWDRLPVSERKALLLVARSMAIQEQLEDPQP